MSQAPRLCGLCRLGLRSGTESRRIRVQKADFDQDALAKLRLTTVPEEGLYQACADCVTVLGPKVAQRVPTEWDHDYKVPRPTKFGKPFENCSDNDLM